MSWTLQTGVFCRNTGSVPSSSEIPCRGRWASSCPWVMITLILSVGRKTELPRRWCFPHRIVHALFLFSFISAAIIYQNSPRHHEPDGDDGALGVCGRGTPHAPDRLAEGRRHRLPRGPRAPHACHARRRRLLHHRREDRGHGGLQLHSSELCRVRAGQCHSHRPG